MKIRIQNLNKSFGNQVIFKDLNISFTLNKDNIDAVEEDVRSVVLIGPSGGGKSTLLRILAGLEKPDSGEIYINSELINYRDDKKLLEYRKSIGIVFQSYNLFSHLNALDNLLLPLTKVHKIALSEAKEISFNLLKKFGLIDNYNKNPSQLSGGQKQRIAIARALAITPKFLLLDEPTSALDPEYTYEVLDTIVMLQEEGIDIIMVTHHLNFAKYIAEKIIFIGNNNFYYFGDKEETLVNPIDPTIKKFVSYVLHY